ncbi:MAG: hypothetical protein IJT42_05035 [Treponema sp.]|nr:hypothetical protein [Treponema sp.]
MKKLFLFLSSIPLLFFFACDDFSGLEIPEKISVKTGAKFEIPMGNGDIKIREKASIEEIQRVLDDNIKKNTSSESETQNKPEVYEYNPPIDGKISESAVMQYIINYPIKEIPLSIGDKNLDNTKLEKIDIPETKFTAPDFTDSISNNLEIKDQTFQMAELGRTAEIKDIGFKFNITSPSFSEMIVRSGQLKIVIEKPTATTVSDDFHMMAKIKLVNASNHSQVIAESDSVDCAQGATIIIDLAGKTIVQNMYIIVDGSISGGRDVLDKIIHTYGVEMRPENLKLDKITGLTITEEDLGSNSKIYIPENFDLKGLNSSLVEATIGKGELDFYCKLPEGWKGIKVKESNFLIKGGVEITNDKFSPDEATPEGYALYKKATLDGVRVVPEKAYTYDTGTVTPGSSSTYTDENISWLKVALEDATIIFAEPGQETELTLSGVCKIESLENIKIKLSDLEHFSGNEDTGLNFSTLLGDIMKGDSENLIKDIKFADSTETDGAKVQGYLFVSKPDIDAEELKDLVISGKVHASYTDDEGNAQPDLYFLGETSSDGSMNMRVPIISFAQAAAENVGKLITNPDVISTKPKDPDDDPENPTGEVLGYSHKIEDGKVSKLLNDRPDNLKISYDLTLNSGSEGILDLNGAAIEELKNTDAKISVSLALVLPLQIQLEDNYDIPETSSHNDGWIKIKDVMTLAKDKEDLADLNKDVFDRGEKKDTDFLKYAEGLKSASITYSTNNTLVINKNEYKDSAENIHTAGERLNIKLFLYTVEEDGVTQTNLFDPVEGESDEERKYRKELKIADGTQSVILSKSEITRILSKEGYPFIPKICAEIEIPKDGDGKSQLQYIPRDGYFSVEGTVHLEFDENIPVEVWSK